MKLSTATLGFPRMGPKRELKFALERFWKDPTNETLKKELIDTSSQLEEGYWKLQKDAGIDKVTVGDQYLYDAVLHWTFMLGMLPTRFSAVQSKGGRNLNTMFAMARGVDGAEALGMKKWITSNYHYMVPEYDESSKIDADFSMFLADVKHGVDYLGADVACPVVLGPVSLAFLTQKTSGSVTNEQLISMMVPVYEKLLLDLEKMGVREVQIHEPALVLDDNLGALLDLVYPKILPKNLTINMVSFMEDVSEANYQWLTSKTSGIDVVSLDFTRGDTIALIEKFNFPEDKTLGVGILDSRNVWKADPNVVRPIIDKLVAKNLNSIRIQPSGSLQYLPYTMEHEEHLNKSNPAAMNVLLFAKEKVKEIESIKNYASGNASALDMHVESWSKFHASRKTMSKSSASIGDRIKSLKSSDFERSEPYKIRRTQQLLDVPLLPTTTIGSFPQTTEIRKLRADLKFGRLTTEQYNSAIDLQIAKCIGVQEGLGLDILVHGEPERTDMVEFFGQQLDGVAFTQHGWVQSFGSRCVRPPIFWNDISRPAAMSVREFSVAQALTSKPVKGMLTGPITILNWSFPRVDISRKEQTYQLALCIRDEVADLESAGCRVIQVDEPALREGMPIRPAQSKEYLRWAVDSFRLATAVAKSETQIHTHMCYCEFDDCMDAIDQLDTDVNSIENARAGDATLRSFQKFGYTKGLGPGLYDIHSPVVPPADVLLRKLDSILECVDVQETVVNPDCGLKTRAWPETIAALQVMVEATKVTRKRLGIV